MINYITKNQDNKILISKDYECLILDIPMTKLFNQLLLKEFTTFSARRKTTKNYFNYKSKIPLIVDTDTLLMSIRSYRSEKSLYINYYSIYKYEIRGGLVYIFFINNHVMKLSEKQTVLEQLKRCEKIIMHIKN